MGKAVLLEAFGKTDSVELKVLEKAIEQLGEGRTARLDYSEIARAAGTSRQSVSYNIDKLVRHGFLISHGEKGFSVADGVSVEV